MIRLKSRAGSGLDWESYDSQQDYPLISRTPVGAYQIHHRKDSAYYSFYVDGHYIGLARGLDRAIRRMEEVHLHRCQERARRDAARKER